MENMIELIIILTIIYVIGTILFIVVIDDMKIKFFIVELIVMTLIISLNVQMLSMNKRIYEIEEKKLLKKDGCKNNGD